MSKRIRLTESDLKQIVEESIQSILPKNLHSIFQLIDKSLSQIDNDTYVSRFYSDENQITIAMSRSVNNLGRQKIIKMMKNYGYKFCTSGANDGYIMMTFEPVIVTESINKALRESNRDIDDDNYFGGGLPDRYFDDDAPDNNDYDEHEITQSEIKQLSDAANTIFKIAYNADCETELLKQASQCIRKFVGLYNAGAI